MSRMLQALKKLETRSAWQPVARRLPAVPEVDFPEVELPRLNEPVVEGIPPPIWEPEPPLAVYSPPVQLEPLPSFLAVLSQDSPYSPVFVAESPPLLPLPAATTAAEQPAELVEPVEPTEPAPAQSAVLVDEPTAGPAPVPEAQPPLSLPALDHSLPRSVSRLERTVSRTLADPIRGEPFRQLAERLAENTQEIAGRTVLMAGVGSLSDTHEVVLHAAAALASDQGRVLVIDGDLCRRTLADQLELADQRGLGDVLRGDCPLKEAIARTTLDHVSLLTAGRAGLILTSTVADQLPNILEQLAAEYRYVLIDGGRTDDPAAPLLARLADATYFVVRLGATDAVEAQAALRTFRTASARVLGCIATS